MWCRNDPRFDGEKNRILLNSQFGYIMTRNACKYPGEYLKGVKYMDKTSLTVDGFVFPSAKEAQIALKEKQNIEVIRQRTPLNDSKAVYELYTKLIERDMFKTMVGYSFLYEMRYRLLTDFQYDEEDLPTVVLPKRMEYDKVSELNKGVMETKLQALMLTKKRMSIVMAALAFMVVAMFVLAAVNPNVGYINAENKILNQYSAWQEELEQREKAVKEKEAQLGIENNE